MTLISPEIKNNEKSIFNEGNVFIQQNYDLEGKIHGPGTVENDRIPVEEKFDFGYLDRKIRKSESKQIILEEDISFENYEWVFYEGGIELDIDDLVIDGNGHSIDGKGKSRIFVITGDNIILKNIIFKNGRSYDNYNYSFNDGGGAIRINNANHTTIRNCRFINNLSEKNAGVIENRGNLTIAESLFEDNAAKLDGGVIDNYGDELYIFTSMFAANTADALGGAIRNRLGELNIIKSTLRANMAKFRGGAIHNMGCRLNVIESSLEDNQAKNDGGAICNIDNEMNISRFTLTKTKYPILRF